MIIVFQPFRIILNATLFVLLSISAINYKTSIYLLYQALGQLKVLGQTQTFSTFANNKQLTEAQKSNLLLVQQIKKYSVDSLAYKPTENFNTIYDQKGEALLWVITACEPFEFKPFIWHFPIVGAVSYKGFFNKELALKENSELLAKGYDVDLRQVSAWSTLGWFQDPLLSNMLDRSKGSLCNLIFHELFHATYYASGEVSYNENLAEFIAHKATIRFLKNDSLSLKQYLQSFHDNKIFDNYMLRKITYLTLYYDRIKNRPDKEELKLKAINIIADSIADLPLFIKTRYTKRKQELLKYKNAYFIGFIQYNSLQDSLERVFNKIYKDKIEKLVQDLKQN